MDKFDDVFRILKEFPFEIDEINKDYLCIICKNILSNAHSGPCGCRFCYDCIGKFLNDEEKFCPGNTNDCKQEKINLNENIHYEPSVNTRISKFFVKCPNKCCQFKDEIRKIENHIRVCNFQPIICPYLNIGCNQSNLVNDDMKNHLLSDIVPHSNLLLELIENMKNEMELLKKDIGELKDANKTLKSEIEAIKVDRKENQICEMIGKERKNNDEIVELNEEMMILKNENRYLKDEMDRMKLDTTNKNVDNRIGKMNANKQTIDIDKIKIKLDIMENQQKEFMKNFDKFYIGNDDLVRKSNEIDDMMINPINTQMKDLQIKISKIRGEFEWKIFGCSKLKKDQQVYSKPFFAFPNGYQMCLSVIFLRNNCGYTLYVYLHLMLSKFDDNLSWPCKCDFSIDLINQNNNQIYKSVRVNYNDRSKDFGWSKPTSERNEGILFLTVSSSNIENLLKNDQLLIKCRANIPQ